MDGLWYAFRICGASEPYLEYLEEELSDMFDSYVEGEWTDDDEVATEPQEGAHDLMERRKNAYRRHSGGNGVPTAHVYD